MAPLVDSLQLEQPFLVNVNGITVGFLDLVLDIFLFSESHRKITTSLIIS